MEILPIFKIEDLFQKSVANFHVTIVSTPTGSGKTLLLPKYMNELLNECVFCSVPRVPIAKDSARVANELVWNGIEKSAGFVTGRGVSLSDNNAVIYLTEGSLINIIAANESNVNALMIDEAHEQSMFLEVLLRKARDLAQKGVKVLISSATIDSNKYRNYFEKVGLRVNTIELPKQERPYKIDFQILQESPVKEIAQLANNGHRCLVGVSGKREIEYFIDNLKDYNCNVPIFAYHSELEDEEIEPIYACEGAMVIVATPILQSGITIKDLSIGYFEGQGKYNVKEGKRNVLTTYDLSKSEMIQWYGRLGRTCNGTVLTSENHLDSRSEMSIPEIMRSSLEEAVLLLANLGIDIRKADLLNQPTNESIEKAIELIQMLQLIDSNECITDFGRNVAMNGKGVRGGIVSVLGGKLGIANCAEKIAAIIQIGTPFRNSTFDRSWYKIGSKTSDLLIWKDVIEWFMENYFESGKLVELPQFKDEFFQICSYHNIFRRNLTKIIRKFYEIDCAFDNQDIDYFPLATNIIFSAFKDSITENNHYVKDARESVAIGGGKRCGNILQIGGATFYEHVTYETQFIEDENDEFYDDYDDDDFPF